MTITELSIVIPMIPITVAALIAVGRLSFKVEKVCKDVDKKVDVPNCNMQHKFISENMKLIRTQLDRMEQKIDG
jgi:hypothetical protein